MKNNNLKNYFVAFLFLVNLSVFAEDGPGDSNGYADNDANGMCLECSEVPSAPINSNILALGVAGILVGAYYFSSKTKKA